MVRLKMRSATIWMPWLDAVVVCARRLDRPSHSGRSKASHSRGGERGFVRLIQHCDPCSGVARDRRTLPRRALALAGHVLPTTASLDLYVSNLSVPCFSHRLDPGCRNDP